MGNGTGRATSGTWMMQGTSSLNAHPVVKEVVVGLPDERSRGETVYAVLLVDDPVVPVKEIVDAIDDKPAGRQRIASYAVWHEEDFPRTHTQSEEGRCPRPSEGGRVRGSEQAVRCCRGPSASSRKGP